MHCRMFICIPSLYPQDARHCQKSPEANSPENQEHSQILSTEDNIHNKNCQGILTGLQSTVYTYPSFNLGRCASAKVTSPACLMKSLRSLTQDNCVMQRKGNVTHKQQHDIKTRLLKEKMLDKVQTWHLPHLYSIRIQKVFMSGHEISK